MNVALIPALPQAAVPHQRLLYAALLETLGRRATARTFAPSQPVAEETYRLILEAARLAPSGANAQPWQFIAITEAALRCAIGTALVAASARRGAEAHYRTAGAAPGCFVIATDFRLSWAYPGLMDGTELDQRYHATAERIILQSVASATTAAHLAAAALGYCSWWISTLGQEDLQAALRALLAVPDDLTITDIMLFGHPARPLARRWKKSVEEIASWNRFDMGNFRSLQEIDGWVRDVQGNK